MIKLLSKYPHNTARRQIAKSLWDFGVGRAQPFGKKCYLLEYQNLIHLGSEKKANSNLLKHGVSFEEATTALHDTFSVTGYDPDHSVDEDRFVTFDLSNKNRLLVVSHTEEGDVIRILSCRPATTPERKIYGEG